MPNQIKLSLKEEFLIKNLMKKDILKLSPETPVIHLIIQMLEKKRSFAAIVDDHEYLVGLVSHFDIFSSTTNLNTLKMPCKTIMNSNIHLIHENEDIVRASEIMMEYNLQRLPVINKQKKIVGLVSSGYILKFIERVFFFMTREVITVKPEIRLTEAIRIMLREHIGSLVVVNKSNPVGIITHQDLLLALSQERMKNSLVRDFMTSPVITIDYDKTITEARNLLEKHSISRLPVVDKHGQLLGIVNSTDLLYARKRTSLEGEPSTLQDVLLYLENVKRMKGIY